MAAARISTLRKGDNQHTAQAASSQSKAAESVGVSTDSVQRGGKSAAAQRERVTRLQATAPLSVADVGHGLILANALVSGPRVICVS